MRRGGEFAFVRARGRVAQGRLVRMQAAATGAGTPARFGFVTSRRVGAAAVRNRIRRRLREIVRAARGEVLAGLMVVTSARPAAAGAKYADLREEWLHLARRLSILRVS